MCSAGIADLRRPVHELVRCGTEPPFTLAAIANAENPNSRSAELSAAWRTSHLRSFEPAKIGGAQSALSLQLGRTNETREYETIPISVFARLIYASVRLKTTPRIVMAFTFFRQN